MELTFERGRLDDLPRPLIRRHHDEVIGEHPHQRLEVDWDRLRLLEEHGHVVVTLARHEDRVVGYTVHVVAPHMHYGFLQAHDDAHYLAPEHRRGLAALGLFRAAEAALRSQGVRYVTFNTLARFDLSRGPVFRRLGYEAAEIVYGKFLED